MYYYDSHILVNKSTAARLLSISSDTFEDLETEGKMGPIPIKFDHRPLYAVEELKQWVRHGCPSRKDWEQIKERI